MCCVVQGRRAGVDGHRGAARVTIEGHYDNAVGTSDAASQGDDPPPSLLKSRPPLRPAEVLEFVPGVIVTQHSGDGKANQYFLRGFNLDHGTDFATIVDGMPVNMPTPRPRPGLHRPELPDPRAGRAHRATARARTSRADGDFASAGSADIVYRTQLDAPFAPARRWASTATAAACSAARSTSATSHAARRVRGDAQRRTVDAAGDA